MTPPDSRHHAMDYIEFRVSDMARAQEFYAQAFGWTFTDYGPEYAGIRRPDGTEAGGFHQTSPVTTGGPLVILYSSELEATLQAVREAGGEVTMEPFDFPGGRRFHFRDPSGHELAVWTETGAG
jgi:predicted enzyme related to lactoylglutathione lyase